jgi:hypothetical protein
MTEDELLQRYGLHPTGPDLDQVREILRGEVARERHRLGDGDTELMKLCCVQLFHHRSLADVLLIWQAKESGWDPHHSIDVQLLCGAGLDATKAFLADDSGGEARKALDYLIECETAGDFDGFTVADQSAWHHRYYRVPLGASGGDD